MIMGKKLEKLVLATILAGSMAVSNSAFAGIADYFDFSNRGEATHRTYNFDGKPFLMVNFYMSPGYLGFIGYDEEKNELRSFFDGEENAVSRGLEYWHDVLGNPVTVPYVDIYLTNSPTSNAIGESIAIGDITKLAKCFQEKTNSDPNSYDAIIMIDKAAEPKKYYTDKLGILPSNGTDDDYQGTIIHEMFHALGILTSFDADFKDGKAALEQHTYTRFENNLYDFRGQKLIDSDKLAIIASPELATDNKTFYFLQEKDVENDKFAFNGIYFKGKHVDEVLNLNGQKALIAWPDDYNMVAVPGIPINGIEPAYGGRVIASLSHFELQNSLQSHQRYRNWSIPMEVELAALEDLGYTIDRRKLYGNSIYNSGIEYVNNNPFYARENGQYIVGKPSKQSLAMGLHVYGSNNTITQKSVLLADGDESMGIRVDGTANKLMIAKDSIVSANGLNGRGINFAYGKEHELDVAGTVSALGPGGKALTFDFGDNMLGNGMEYRGSYIRVKLDGENTIGSYSLLHPALEGPLMNNVNISGTVAGKDAAIYIAPNAYVKNINIKTGAMVQGDIISDWSPTGIPGVMGRNLNVEEMHIHLPEGDDGLTGLNFAGENLSYDGNIGSKLYGDAKNSELGVSSIIMNVNSGTLNYNGTANVDSVNVREDAVLQGGTFNLDTNGSNIREGLSKENSGKLTNQGMISAALPNGENTVLTINGDVVNNGGTLGFIANGDNVGTIKIDGELNGEKTLAVNPNGSYLPGDTFDVTGLVKVGDEYVTFDNALAYETSMLKASYGEDFDSISFVAENNLNSNDTNVNAAFDEMTNLSNAVSASENQAWQEKLGELYKSDSAKATKALKSIKGSEVANIPVLMQQNNLVRNTLGMRMSQVNRAKNVKVNIPVKQLTEGKTVAEPMDITVQPEYDMWAKISRNKGAVNAESDYKTDAYSIGWDKQVSKDWRFGFFGSYAKGKFEADTIRNDLQDYRLGVYGGYNKNAAEAIVYADYGWGKNKLHRNLNFMNLATKSKYDSNIMELGAEYKYDLHHKDNKAWHVAPYGAMQVNRYSQKAYAETGAEPFNKNVAKLNNTYAAFETGIDLERRLANGSAYGMRLGYRRGLTGTDPKQSYHYAADPLHRYVNYGESDKNKLVLRVNGQVQTGQNWSISGEAGYERGKKGHGYSGEISLKYSW